MKKGPTTLLRRTWIVPVGFGTEDGGRHQPGGDNWWGNIQPAHVIVERVHPNSVSELTVMIGDHRILSLEREHPAFYGWMTGLIDALAEAIREPCTLQAWADEKPPEWVGPETWEEKLKKCCSWMRMSRAELANALDGIPAGATPVLLEERNDWTWNKERREYENLPLSKAIREGALQASMFMRHIPGVWPPPDKT